MIGGRTGDFGFCFCFWFLFLCVSLSLSVFLFVLCPFLMIGGRRLMMVWVAV